MKDRPPQAPRCWLDEDLCTGAVSLAASERKHLQNVRRVRSGDEVCVLNGRGQLGVGRWTDRQEIEIDQVLEVPPQIPALHLYLGALKQSAWEEVLRHATELGVRRILRVDCTHAVSKLEGKEEKKIKRWKELLREACKQSANPWCPELGLFSSVAEALRDPQLPEVQVLAQLGGDVETMGQLLQDGLASAYGIWIGPEGDFTSEEMAAIRNSGARPVSLGPQVLRAETAALSLLSRLRLHR